MHFDLREAQNLEDARHAAWRNVLYFPCHLDARGGRQRGAQRHHSLANEARSVIILVCFLFCFVFQTDDTFLRKLQDHIPVTNGHGL